MEQPSNIKETQVTTGTTELKDFIAPSALQISSNNIQLGEKFARTIFIVNYPRFLNINWLNQIINFPRSMDISMFIHPTNTSALLRKLKKKLTEVESQISLEQEKGKVRNPILETARRDIETLRDKLIQGTEKFFKYSLYITIYGDSVKELNEIEGEITSILDARMINTKVALFQQADGLNSTFPLGEDRLFITNSLNSAPLSTSFPFVSSNLTSNKGILYGINRHNNSLVLFDRFSLENANMVIFGKAGGGKTIHKDESVLIKNKDGIQLTKIGPLVEKLIKKHGATQIDEEIEGAIDPEIEVYSFNKNLKGEWSKVTVAMRKKAPKVYYKIRTRSGREITTTGDHNMVLLKQGKVVVAKTSETKKGEFIPLPRKISGNQKDQIFRESPEKNQKANFPINQESLQLAGLVTAEGTVGVSKSYFYIDISNIDPEILNIITSSLQKLDIPFHKVVDKKKKRIRAIRIYNQDFCKTVKASGGGGKSKEKKVWPFIFNLEKKKIAHYLSAYFEGDGGVERWKSKTLVTATSKSKRLISEISYLLYYFGIIARVTMIKKKATNANWKRKRTYWRLTISGRENLQKFAENINFISQKKKKLLAQSLQQNKQGNTNVDVIPEIKNIFNEIYQLFKPQLYGIPEISEWKLGKRNPSPQHLQKVIQEIENRIEHFKNLNSTFEILAKIPSLASIIDLGKTNKELNKKLWQNLGQNWRLMKNQKVKAGSNSVFKAIETINGHSYSLQEIKSVIHRGFKEMGSPIKHHNRSLQSALVARPESNTQYEMIENASKFILKNYQEFLNKIPLLEQKLNQLKILANSDLFWDPIVEIKKTENRKEKYVYDLTVDNEVFLAGQGGMFVHNSYATKLEVLRSLMFGTDVIIIDPENEYQYLAETVGGAFFKISLTSPHHINPFDLTMPGPEEKPEDILRSNIIELTGLLKIIFDKLTAEEESVLDKAIVETYASRDITPQSDFKAVTPPLLSDLKTILEGMEGGESMAKKLGKYTEGSFSGFLNKPTNINLIGKNLVVFSIRDMEEELRPVAMYVILHFIWNLIRSELKKRLLIVDEAWWLMKYESGGSFLHGIAKRCRKYYLGLTTITQDIPDFMESAYGKPIITNSSFQMLFKQSPATIDIVKKTFNLTDEEKYLLLESGVGEGIFFAGLKHVAIKVVASYTEDQIITSNPEQLLQIEKAKKELARAEAEKT